MNVLKRLLFVASLVFWVAVWSPPLFTQGSTAALSGRVVDPNGLIVVGAQVEALNVGTNVAYRTLTNQAGLYNLPALPPGEYRIEVGMVGFERAIQSGVSLHVAESPAVNFTLRVGSITENVEVTGEVSVINTTTSSLGSLVNDRQMADLPLNGRNIGDLMVLEPGVSVGASFGGMYALGLSGNMFSSNGAPIQSNYYSLDGASMVNAAGVNSSSLIGTTLGVGGVKEFKMVSSAYDATYGMTMGSQMIMLSKSGTDKWHGEAFEYLRNAALDSKNYFDTPASAGKTYAGAQRRLPPFRRNNFGASFGGPVKKEKVFFYASYEGFRQLLSGTGNTVLPSAACHNLISSGSDFAFPDNATASNCAAGLTAKTTIPGVMKRFIDLYPLPNNGPTGFTRGTPNKASEDFGQIRLDYNISTSDALFGRYTIDWTRMDNDTTLHLSGVLGYNHNQFITVGETHTFSPSLLNQVRISYSRTNITADNNFFTDLTQPQYQMIPGIPMGLISVPGISGIGSGVGYPYRELQGLSTFSDDVFYTRGNHSLKFGALINRFGMYDQYCQFTPGYVTFPSLASFMKGLYNTFLAPRGNNRRDYLFYTLGFYAQDDIHLTPRFTLNAGLRYEFMTTVNEVNGIQSRFMNFADPTQSYTLGPPLQNPGHLPFSPRIGFAWDVFGKGRTAIRGGAGIYYDVGAIGGGLVMTVVAQPPFAVYNAVVDSANTSNVLQMPLNFSAPGATPPAVQTLDYYYRLPRSYQFNLTFEQQLPLGIGLSVSYVGNQGRKLWQFAEANPYLPSRIVNGVKEWDPYTCNGVLSPIPCTGGAVQASNPAYRRVNPNYGMAIMMNTHGSSSYNALQVVGTKRLSKGLDFTGTFTWSHAIDTAIGQIFNAEGCGANALPLDPINRGNERASSCFDKRYNFHLSTIYQLPNPVPNRFVSNLTGGWWMGSIVTMHTGYPFTANISNLDRSQSGVFANNRPTMDRADLGTTTQTLTLPVSGGTYTYTFIPYDKDTVITGDPNHWFNPLMFRLPATGQIGNVARSTLRGPGRISWDLSLNKDINAGFLGEQGKVQFRAEAFNVLNHPNFGMPGNTTVFTGVLTNPAGASEAPAGASVTNPLGNAGRIMGTSTSARQLQFALKLIF